MHYSLNEFTEYLETIDLNQYRLKYTKIKTVEMDLPRGIQALDSIYDVYWNDNYKDGVENCIPSYEEYYRIYYTSCEKEILEFWKNSGFGMDCDCFPRGLEARIYRTWASLITQIHGGYVAEDVFGEGSVQMSTELDHRNIDILIRYRNQDIKIQVKKESKRPEINRMHNGKASTEQNGIYNIWYVVPKTEEYLWNSRYMVKSRQGELRDSLKSFVKFNPKEGTLDRLDNGFIIFTPREFQLIKTAIDEKLKC